MDSLVEETGANGRFQKATLMFLSAIQSLASMTFYVTIFNVAEPELNCVSVSQNYYKNNTDSTTLNKTTCDMWNNFTLTKELQQVNQFNCEFKTDYYEKTIINEWNLVCEKKSYAAATQTIFLIGNIAAFLSGIISDRFGRKKATIIFLGLFSIFSIIFSVLMENYPIFSLSISSRYIIYCIFQLLSGILSCCIQISVYVHLIEFTSDDYHILVSNVTSYFYIGGEIFVLVIFYFTRSWTITNWHITIFSVVTIIPFCLFIPESPRWLAELNRFDEAYEVLEKIAKFNNKKKIGLNKETSIRLMQTHQFELELNEKSPESVCKKPLETKPVYKRIFSLSSILGDNFNYWKFLAIFIVYNSITLVYVGVTVGITTLSDMNPFIMYLFSSLFELIGIIICHINDYIGRKRAILLFTSFLTITSFLVALFPKDTDPQVYTFLIIKTIFTLLSRIFISAAYNTLMCYTAELYEVKIRNTVLSFMICAGCLLSLFSPQINMLEESVWDAIPYLIYSSCSLLSAFIIFFLPETYHFSSKDNKI